MLACPGKCIKQSKKEALSEGHTLHLLIVPVVWYASFRLVYILSSVCVCSQNTQRGNPASFLPFRCCRRLKPSPALSLSTPGLGGIPITHIWSSRWGNPENLPNTITKDDSKDIGRQDLDRGRYLLELEKMCVRGFIGTAGELY